MAFDAVAFGGRLRRYRKDKKVSANELGDALDVNAVHVRHMERGDRKPSIDALIGICNKLQVSPDDLLIDSLDEYARGQNAALADTISHLTPSQKAVIMATINALLEMPVPE